MPRHATAMVAAPSLTKRTKPPTSAAGTYEGPIPQRWHTTATVTVPARSAASKNSPPGRHTVGGGDTRSSSACSAWDGPRRRCLSIGSLDHWIAGSLDHWITGSLDHGITGSLDHWIAGSLDHWITGYWITGSLDHWINGSVDHWITGSITGSLDRWIIGSLDRWVTGSLDRWITVGPRVVSNPARHSGGGRAPHRESSGAKACGAAWRACERWVVHTPPGPEAPQPAGPCGPAA